VEPLQRCRRLETDHEDRDVEFIEEALLITQLRDVLSARYSPEPAQEHEQHWFADVGPQRDTVPPKIQQLNVENIVHCSPLMAVEWPLAETGIGNLPRSILLA